MFGFPLKRRKPLNRSRKRIRSRGKFKAFGANQFKKYHRKRTDAEVMAHALARRAENLQKRTRAEMAFAQLLDERNVLYEVEKIFLNGDRYILVDFYFKDYLLAIEVDGSAHDDQKSYDAGRDQWLLSAYGVKTIRIENREVLRTPEPLMQMVMMLLRKHPLP